MLHSLNASGHLQPQTFAGQEVPTLLSQRRGHCLTGPIAVRGAVPGEVLAVRFVSLRPDTWGYTTAGVKAMALALASPVLDLRVTQVANQSWGVHALLPAGAIS